MLLLQSQFNVINAAVCEIQHNGKNGSGQFVAVQWVQEGRYLGDVTRRDKV